MKPMDDVDECMGKCIEAGVLRLAVNRQPDGSIDLNCEVRDWTFKTSEQVLALIPPGGRLEIWAE